MFGISRLEFFANCLNHSALNDTLLSMTPPVPKNFALRLAKEDEANQLSDLASRSKAHWPYDEDYLRQCAELTRRPIQLNSPEEVLYSSYPLLLLLARLAV